MSLRSHVVRAAVLVALQTSAPAAQTAGVPSSSPTIDRDAAAIGRGWSAFAMGRRDAAVKAADEVLRRDARHHAAIELKIEAIATAEPIRALDAYETWLGQGLEDVFLLGPIARATLREAAAGSDRMLQIDALQRLAKSGDAAAARKLDELNTAAGPAADLQRARAGDAAAARRLLDAADAPGLRPETLAEVLPAAGAAAVPKLIELLKHPAPPVRAAAAMSLGALHASEAVPILKDLLAKDQMNSAWVAVALARLGDQEGEAAAQDLLRSPVHDTRLLAAQAYADKGPGPWVDALVPLLDDPNGLTRIRAAELLSKVEPEKARAVLEQAATDPNPVVRGDVARVIEATEPDPSDAGIANLRRLLRDADVATRTRAAGAILRLIRSG